MADVEDRLPGFRVPDDTPDDSSDDGEQIIDDEDVLRHVRYWVRWYNMIVERELDLDPQETTPLEERFVTDDTNPVPFLLNLNEAWFCGALVLLTLAAHHGVREGWLWEDGYPYPKWAARVLGRVFLTVGAAVLSTCGFEVVASILTRLFFNVVALFQSRFSIFLVENLGWGQVNEEGLARLDDENNLMWIEHDWFPREMVRDGLHGSVLLALTWVVRIFSEWSGILSQLLMRRTIAPALHFLFAIPTDFVPKLLSFLYLPTPGTDGIRDPRSLWFEYGMAIVIQFWVVVFLCLLRILYQAKADRFSLQGFPVIDPQMALVWHLIRATSMHLIAYTAYQLVCGTMVGIRSLLAPNSAWITFIDGPMTPIPYVAKIAPEGRIIGALLLFLVHYLFRAASVKAVIYLESFWMPYILWQTQFAERTIGIVWNRIWLTNLRFDLRVRNPSQRVTSRAIMTALFGLKSSWPAWYDMSEF